MTPDASPYIASIIAVGGTLLGGLVAGTFTLIQMRRTLGWQKQDAERRYILESERWAHGLREERDKIFWMDRRALYGRLLNAIDKVITTLTDLHDIELPTVHVGDMTQTIAASPLVVRYFAARDTFAELRNEVFLVGHDAVVQDVRTFDKDLHDAARVALALQRTNNPSNVRDSYDRLVQTMRSQLFGEGNPPSPAGMARPKSRSTNFAWWNFDDET
ncbi:MAG: hypothetical protein AB7I38_19305 [Dehalococcoidia bacterium]